MKNYAYLDKYGILHISNDKKLAETYAKLNGKVLETGIEASHGYPTFTVMRNGREIVNNIVAYSSTDIKVDGKNVNARDFGNVVELYENLM